jgi:hypothetical protein
MTTTATAAAARRSTARPTLKTSMRTFAAVVALAAGASLYAAPSADARPPRDVEDRIKEARDTCLARRQGKWRDNGAAGFTCSYRIPGSDVLKHYDLLGRLEQICYRFDVESPWTCV